MTHLAALAAWLATYLVHSTVALGAAWVVDRRFSHRPRLLGAVWRFALVAGLLTATLQVGLGVRPLGGRRSLPLAAAPATATAPAVLDRLPVPPGPAAALGPSAPGPSRSAPAGAGAHPRPPLLLLLVVGGWAAGAALGLLALAGAWWRFRRRLRDRREVTGAARGMLDRLCRMASPASAGELALTGVKEANPGPTPAVALRLPVRLTRSRGLEVPVAMGVLRRREICLPERALVELDDRQLEAMVAHELAHLRRGDPAWLLGAAVLGRLLFLQPLHRLAARRLSVQAELACDELAARWTDRPLALADCLAEVAAWLLGPTSALPAPAMAAEPSLLRRRVERLLGPGSAPERLPGWFWPAALLLGGALLLVAPSCASRAAGASPPLAAMGSPQGARAESADRCDDDGDADDRDDDDDGVAEIHETLSEVPEQIEEALGAVEEARDALSAEILADVDREVRQALAEARRGRPGRAELARAEKEVERAMKEVHRALEKVRKTLPPRAELERVQREMQQALDQARRSLASPAPGTGQGRGRGRGRGQAEGEGEGKDR